ncbi:MAG: type II secretion system protein [Candidatus Eisenbacteria bacterium]|nr:type II secretion system protein [Candidatus Eisenbacteria bacterium]
MSLLETAFAVAIVGSLLAVLIPTFVRRVEVSKTSEAIRVLEEMHLRTAAYFDRTHEQDSIARRWCLPDEAGPTPRFPSVERVEFDFQAETSPGHATWRAIGFAPGPVRFRYSLVPESTGCGIRRPSHVPVVSYVAEGDLDVDGTLSTYERSDSVDDEGRLVPEGALRIHAPVE